MAQFHQKFIDFILDNVLRVPFTADLIQMNLSIPHSELVALLILNRRDQVIMSDLAQELAIPLSTATGVIDRLVSRGWVDRFRNPDDRRIVVTCLSEEGRRQAEDYLEHISSYAARLSSVLTEEEQGQLLRIAAKVIGAFSNRRVTAEGRAVVRKIPVD